MPIINDPASSSKQASKLVYTDLAGREIEG